MTVSRGPLDGIVVIEMASYMSLPLPRLVATSAPPRLGEHNAAFGFGEFAGEAS